MAPLLPDWPAAHPSHAFEFAVAWYLPAGQSVHDDEPAPENVPGGHAVHEIAAEEPMYLPPGHPSHAPWVAEAWYLPAGQSVHDADEAVANVPTPQPEHGELVAATSALN